MAAAVVIAPVSSKPKPHYVLTGRNWYGSKVPTTWWNRGMYYAVLADRVYEYKVEVR